MKTKIVFAVLMSLLLSACFDDDSNMKIEKISPIRIDLGDMSTNLTAYVLDTLQINPIVYKEGSEDEKLSYKWEISGNDIIPEVLGNTMQLKAVVTMPMNNQPYDLILTVTDNETQLQNYAEFKLSVLSNFGKGLVVADTKDGVNSDLNLIMSYNFSYSLWSPFAEKDNKTMYSVFSLCNNGQLLNGMVKGMQAVSLYGANRSLTVITDHSMVRMDPYDYLIGKENGDLFFVPVPQGDKFIPRQIAYDGGPMYEIVNLDGTIYSRRMREGNLYYGAPLETSLFDEYEISKMIAYPAYHYYESVYYFDEKQNRFLSSASDHAELNTIPHITSGAFDPDNIGKKDALFMGYGNNDDIYTLFKAEEGNEYSLYTFTPQTLNPQGEFTPQSVYDFTNATDIDKAVAYETSSYEELLYYATDTKIYAALLTGRTPSVFERYTVAEPGAKITSIKLWRQAGQGRIKMKNEESETGYSEVMALGQMMMVTTYNEATGEGKVICIPISVLGSGTLEKDTSFHKEYGGFGKILYIEPQTL